MVPFESYIRCCAAQRIGNIFYCDQLWILCITRQWNWPGGSIASVGDVIGAPPRHEAISRWATGASSGYFVWRAVLGHLQHGKVAQHLVPLSQGIRLQLSNRRRSLSKATIDAALLSALGTRIPTPPCLKMSGPPRLCRCASQERKKA